MKLQMVGKCEKCGKVISRPYPADTAVCECSSVTLVHLTKAIQFSKEERAILLKPSAEYKRLVNKMVKFLELSAMS